MARPLLVLLSTSLMTWAGFGGTLTSSSPFLPCGPCVCSTSGPTVDCSSRSLTAVPHTSLLPPNATTLLLNNNSISSLPPSVFKAFRSLHTLDLSHNRLTSISSAAVFDGLDALLTLTLSYNQLSFDDCLLPAERRPFLALTSLRHLNMRHNLLSDVSKNLGLSVDTLRWLDLSHNCIRSSNESRMVNFLSSLTFLDLSYNHLSSLKGLFEGISHLQTLDLRHNQIPLNDSAYPADVFEPFQCTLGRLTAEGNCKVTSSNHSMNYPHLALSRLTNLTYLSIDGLPHADFGQGFHNMTSLANLSLSGLDEGYCSMKKLTSDIFRFMPDSVRRLNLSECDIDAIDMNAFKYLSKMEVLDLSFNIDLGFDTLGEAFYSLQGSALRTLHINSIIRPYTRCIIITPHNTRYFKNTSLEDIHARNNRLETFCEGVLNNMPDTLRFVGVDANNLGFGIYFRDLGSLKNLRLLHNDGNRLALDPPTEYPHDRLPQCSAGMSGAVASPDQCQRSWRPDDSEDEVWAPALEGYSRHATSSQHKKLVFTLPPRLEEYVSRWNKLYYKILDVEFHPNNSLKILNLSNNLLATWIGPVIGLNELVVLDLDNNFAYNVSDTFFDTLTSLRTLNASRNNLRPFIKNDRRGRWFQPLSQLEKLYLSKNYINLIPTDFFKGLVNLQTLVLSHNEIFTFDANITMMWNISLLDLSYNNIHFLPQFIMDHLDRVARTPGHTVTVDMTFNPIACTCQHIDFLTWILYSPVLFPTGNHYSCLKSDGSVHNLTDIFQVTRQLQETCMNKSGILVGAVSCFICLMMVLVAALVFRYRWKLRYLYYASRLHYSRLDRQQENDDDFLYDAFVSYCSEDNDFVHGQLMEELESRAGLRLNIHHRDFTPGRPIPSNIVDAVQKSRHTLVVLTPALVGSDWCHYEMQMATMEAAYTGRDVLVFLLYQDVPNHQMPRDVFYLLQASTYISYPSSSHPQNDSQLLRDFWARLVQAVRH